MVKVMEEKNNIAKILKDKPEGTKLWTDMFGSVTLYVVTDTCDAFQVKHHNKEPWFDKDGKLYEEGVLCIYPSKSMRSWHKFAWKKGDVLVSNDGKREVLFKTWVNDSYTKFVGLHCLINNDNEEVEYDNGTTVFNTNDFKGIEAEDVAQTYISTIEERLGGKLNRETLEVEKQPEFKDGDILYCEGDSLHLPMTLILKTLPDKMQEYAYMNNETYDWLHICCDKTLDAGDISRLRYATEEEKQHLFNALAKKGKAWDAEKKEVIDLKPIVDELKPFDKVLVRDNEDDIWEVSLFGYKDELYYRCDNGIPWIQCIPYDGNEHLLGTTNNVEG